MPLYVCRWQNGDFSVVQANNKEHAIEMLDEVANAEGYPLYAIIDFMVHFRLTDSGEIELQGFESMRLVALVMTFAGNYLEVETDISKITSTKLSQLYASLRI
jgi:hypothetical protein